MIAVSLVAMRVAETRGYRLVPLVSFLALPIRGLIAFLVIDHRGVYPVRVLVGVGLQSAVTPGSSPASCTAQAA